jgi:hypothetical protein
MTQLSKTQLSKTEPSEVLQGIRGIGPARQKWLQETLNIITIDDLAMASWESIEFEVSQDEGIIIPRREIQSWIAQAQAERPDVNLGVIEPDSESDSESLGLSEQNVLEITGEIVSDEITPDATIAIAPIAIVIPDLSLQITQIQIIQGFNSIPYTIVPGQCNLPVLWKHQPLTIEVQFELGLVPSSHDAIAAATYHIQCHAQNRVTQWTTTLETPFSSPLIPDQTVYNSCLPPIQLDIGIYRLQIWVTLQGIRSVGYFDIPLIQIT